jgi:hypothetical protein
MRPKKQKIELNKDSLQDLMQEIYNDCVSGINNARKELNERKSRAEIEDINDEYQIGKVNNESLKLIESLIEKKLSLAKLQSQILSNSLKESEGDNKSTKSLSEEDKETLRDLFKKQKEDNNTEYEIE